MDALDTLLKKLPLVAFQLLLLGVRQGQVVKQGIERIKVRALHLHEVESTNLLRYLVVLLGYVVRFGFWIAHHATAQGRAVDPYNDDLVVRSLC